MGVIIKTDADWRGVRRPQVANCNASQFPHFPVLYILSVYSLSVCSFLYVFICLSEMVNKDKYIQGNTVLHLSLMAQGVAPLNFLKTNRNSTTDKFYNAMWLVQPLTGGHKPECTVPTLNSPL